MNNTNPFTVKGVGYTTPKGKALWCKLTPERKFNPAGDIMTSLVCDPNDDEVKAFVKTLEDLRDQAFKETAESLGAAKSKGIKARAVFIEDVDKDGKETGKIVFRLKLKNVDDKIANGRQSEIVVVDSKKIAISVPPKIGNGSIIRCAGFANPYYMASTKEVGISLLWSKLQIIELVGFGSDDDFGEEEGYSAISSAVDNAIAGQVDMTEVPF